ncbi:MAG: DNA-binding CsgD family transcriptional regulator [Crocinitomix sp.]
MKIIKYKYTFVFLLGLLSNSVFGQSEISGYLNLPNGWHNEVYLSVIYDYREMTNIQKKQIIAVASIDSSGYFEFSESLFVEKELIYRLHLTNQIEEVEVYLADYSEGGFGYNHVVFQAKKGDNIFLDATDDHIFGNVVSENKAAGSWQLLNDMEQDYRSRTFELGNNQLGHLVVEHQKIMLENVKGNGVVAGVVAAFFLLKEDVDLSSGYLEAYKNNRAYFYEVLEGLKVSHPFYADRLNKELAVIDLQLNGDELIRVKKENGILRIVSVVLLLLSIVLFFWIKKIKKSPPLIELTQQEMKIHKLILEGFSNKEIAEQLFISLSTVKTHINTLYKKRGVSSRKELMIKESTRD